MFIVTECNSIRWIWNDCTKGNIKLSYNRCFLHFWSQKHNHGHGRILETVRISPNRSELLSVNLIN